MAGNTFEERLTRLEEQFKALQALTQGLAAWEMGGLGVPELDKVAAPERSEDHAFAALESGPHHDEGREPTERRRRDRPT
jgi:hypothetical protein